MSEGNLIYNVGNGHLVYNVGNGHLVYSAPVPATIPVYFGNVKIHVVTTGPNVFNVDVNEYMAWSVPLVQQINYHWSYGAGDPFDRDVYVDVQKGWHGTDAYTLASGDYDTSLQCSQNVGTKQGLVAITMTLRAADGYPSGSGTKSASGNTTTFEFGPDVW